MKKLIREKYENGILVSREIEVSGIQWAKLAKLGIHLVVAVSLAAIAITTVYDSLMANVLNQATEMTGTVCQEPGFRS